MGCENSLIMKFKSKNKRCHYVGCDDAGNLYYRNGSGKLVCVRKICNYHPSCLNESDFSDVEDFSQHVMAKYEHPGKIYENFTDYHSFEEPNDNNNRILLECRPQLQPRDDAEITDDYDHIFETTEIFVDYRDEGSYANQHKEDDDVFTYIAVDHLYDRIYENSCNYNQIDHDPYLTEQDFELSKEEKELLCCKSKF
jgi:hypothetical protein